MKKVITIVFSIMIFSAIQAQDLRLGFRLNPNFGWFNINDKGSANLKNDGIRPGFSYGVITDYFFTDNYGITSGIYHLFQNGRTFPTGDTFKYYKWDLQYIQIPIALKLKTNEIGSFEYYGFLGIYNNLNVSREIDAVSSKNIRFYNIGLNLGAGVHYELGGNAWALGGISFQNGYMKINKQKEFDVKTSCINLDLGVIF